MEHATFLVGNKPLEKIKTLQIELNNGNNYIEFNKTNIDSTIHNN